MGLETGTYISDLVSTNPLSSDAKSQGDDHIRFIKAVILATFPNINGAMTASDEELNILDGATLSTAELNILDGVTASTAELNILDGATLTTTELNYVDGVTSAIQTQIDLKAPLANPALTGTPTAPTASTGTSTTQVATTEFVANTSFTTNLPAQTGNNGKLLKTDGTNAAWSATIDTSIVLPVVGTTLATTTGTEALTNKTLQTPVFQDSSDSTKKANLILSGITAGQNRNVTLADENMTLFTPGWRFLTSVTASNSATVDVEHALDNTYDMYVIVCSGVTFTATGTLSLRMKIGGAYVTTATYSYLAPDGTTTSGVTFAPIVVNAGIDADDHMSLNIYIPTPYSTAFAKTVFFNGFNSNVLGFPAYGCKNSGTGALTGIRLYNSSSGNIAAGNFQLYGMRKV